MGTYMVKFEVIKVQVLQIKLRGVIYWKKIRMKMDTSKLAHCWTVGHMDTVKIYVTKGMQAWSLEHPSSYIHATRG
jgi:hypothetical protein